VVPQCPREPDNRIRGLEPGAKIYDTLVPSFDVNVTEQGTKIFGMKTRFRPRAHPPNRRVPRDHAEAGAGRRQRWRLALKAGRDPRPEPKSQPPKDLSAAAVAATPGPATFAGRRMVP
jgi:hypothetical protein